MHWGSKDIHDGTQWYECSPCGQWEWTGSDEACNSTPGNTVKLASEKYDSERIEGYFDFVVISSGDEKWLLAVEADTSYRSIMLIKFIKQSTHSVVPKLDDTTVQAIKYKKNCKNELLNWGCIKVGRVPGKNPWTFRVERKTFHSGRLCFKLGEHFSGLIAKKRR